MSRVKASIFTAPAAILAALTAAGALLRLSNIGTEPFWGDEVLSLDIVLRFSGDVPEMLRYLREVEIHPPLYYLLLAPWVKWFGPGEFAVRLLSLVFSVATIPAAYALGRRLFSGHAPGLVAAGVLAVLPFQIEFGQEARPYAILCFFGTLAALCLWSRLRGGGLLPVAGYVLSLSIVIHLHYSGMLVAAALSGWWLLEIAVRPRADGKVRAAVEWLAAHAAVFLLFAWWLDAFLFKLLLSGISFTDLPDRNLPTVRPHAFFWQTLTQLVWTSKTREIVPIEIFAQGLFIIALILAAARAACARPLPPAERSALGFLGWTTAAVLMLFLLSPASLNYAPLFERHVIFLTVPPALFLGWLAGRLHWKPAAVLLALLAASLVPRVADIAGDDAVWDRYHNLKPAAEHINANWKPGDVVIMPWRFTRSDFNHFLRPELSAVALLPPGYLGGDFWDSRQTLGFLENELQFRISPVRPDELRAALERVIRASRPERVWLYGFSRDYHAVHQWFEESRWRHALVAPANFFLLDLYVKE